MNSLANSSYHRILRISTVVLAAVLVFQSGLLVSSTAHLAEDAQVYMAAAIGVKASVKETELNRYTALLTEREQELDEREAAVAEREIAVGLSTESPNPRDRTTFILSAILFILLVLIILNYVLDFLRRREQYEISSVS